MTKMQKAAMKLISTTPQTAIELGVSERTLLALVCQERIKCTPGVPKKFFI